MSTTLLDVEAVRARYTALQRPLAFFDGPGGTQCPDEVIDAIADYMRHSNANIGAPYEPSRLTDALVEDSRERAASFLGCAPEETIFGPTMTNLSFMLTRTLGRTRSAGDEIVVTKLDPDANVAAWLELALDLDDLEAKLSDRTKVVAFPAAANSVGTAPDVRRIVELAHEAGALAWVDAVHYGPHGPIDVAEWGCDVLICSPYKFFGPHLGLAFGRADLLAGWRPYKVRPSASEPLGHRFETGTLPHELLAGFVAAVDYVHELGWDAIVGHERSLGERFLAGLPAGIELHGLPTMEGRVPTFCFSVAGRSAEDAAVELAARDLAVWHGNYYALETMQALSLDEQAGAVRAGIVHYNTAEEVDRLLAALAELCAS